MKLELLLAPVLQFDGVSKHYRRGRARGAGAAPVRALEQLTLAVEAGEIFGFLGANGAGKTTAIHIAMGFASPSVGSGTLLGQPFGDTETRRRVGFVAENVPLHLRPARKLLGFYGALNGVARPTLDRRTAELLETLGLSDRAGDNVKGFSRGMQQRVALAQSLVNDPELLIMDEPTSALDPVARVAVRELLQRLRDQGKTIFFSSHQLSDVERICDRVAILRGGRIAAEGTLESLLMRGGQCAIRVRGLAAGQMPRYSPEAKAYSARAVEGSLVEFVIPWAEQRQAIESIWAAGGEIVSLGAEAGTLEELFLDVAGAPSAEEAESGRQSGERA